MKQILQHSRWCARAFLVALVLGLACRGANAQLTIIGTQFQPNQTFPEFGCFWHEDNYPGPYPTDVPGATVHVYVKNTGASSVTITDAKLAGYSLATVIAPQGGGSSGAYFSSIYYWDSTPPADIMAAGAPVWYRIDPPTIAPGAVAQVAVCLRTVPTTPTVAVGVVTAAGTVTTNITVDVNAPQLASIGYSADLTKVYLHWRRSGGAAPASVWLDGANVTPNTTTVGDTNLDFAASTVSLASPLPFFSYHVFQGLYPDGKLASASQRAWTNKFLYSLYGSFTATTTAQQAQWVATATDHGVNDCRQKVSMGVGDYMSTSAGAADCLARDYGYIPDDIGHLNNLVPDLWWLYDEPDAHESACGLFVQSFFAMGQTLRQRYANVPITLDMDNSFKPNSYSVYGQALDVLQFDNYYQRRLSDSYWRFPLRIPLYSKALFVYAHARAACAGAEPNPSQQILYSCSYRDPNDTSRIWPFPTPDCKRLEVYYSLAGGSKGILYWWMPGTYPSKGLDAQTPEALAVWKEMGLLGNEIKTARPLLVKSTPVNLPITPNDTNIWVRTLASGHDTLLLLLVNANHSNDIAGCHYTNVANATVNVTLPSWMQSLNTTAFEITKAGRPGDASSAITGSQFAWYLGTLQLTRLLVITTDPTLRSTIQAHYDSDVNSHVRNFASEYCQSPPAVTQQPAALNVCSSGTATFSVAATTGGADPITYQWQRNGINLADGGHYSGATSTQLTVSAVENNEVGNYRCLVGNLGGSTYSSQVALTQTPAGFTQQPAATNVCPGWNATFAVAAFGNGTITYQWQTNGVSLSGSSHYGGCTTATLTVSNCGSADVANYGCVATAACGSFSSSQAALTVGTTVTGQPLAQTVCSGANVTFNVTAVGDGTLTYQWRTNGVSLANNSHYGGCTTAALTISNVGSADAVSYECVVTGGCGIASSTAALTLGAAVTITGQPSDQIVNTGGWISFSITAAGYGTLTYQWQKNNVNLSDDGHYSGCTTATLTILGADTNDAANYRCVAAGCGSTTSSPAKLTVNLCIPGVPLEHGDMEDESPYAVCPDWQSYSAGAGSAAFHEESTIVHGGSKSQECDNGSSGNGSILGVRQTFDANVGDAFTFEGWVNAGDSIAHGEQVAMVVSWDGSTGNPVAGIGSWNISTGAKSVWTHLQNLAGNATATSVTLFLDSRMSKTGYPLLTYWDDVASYRAYMPPAPVVSIASSTSLNVDVVAGCNLFNTSAQYAISIGGGGYTLGTHWVQANGTVGTTAVWQSEVAWATRTVTGLATGTAYTLKAKARYSSAYPQPTSLGAGATLTPVGTQPPQLLVQGNGSALTLTWPTTPSSHLQRAGSLTPPMDWATDTNTVTVIGSQNSVTLTPTGSAGFYRLVLD